MAAKGYIKIDESLCKACQLCLSFCPKSLISMNSNLNTAGYQPATFKDQSECTGCAICALVCPEVAIEVYRE
jgi:2-oxoglutarate ferredoxin oxidoreductase subunit delta